MSGRLKAVFLAATLAGMGIALAANKTVRTGYHNWEQRHEEAAQKRRQENEAAAKARQEADKKALADMNLKMFDVPEAWTKIENSGVYEGYVPIGDGYRKCLASIYNSYSTIVLDHCAAPQQAIGTQDLAVNLFGGLNSDFAFNRQAGNYALSVPVAGGSHDCLATVLGGDSRFFVATCDDKVGQADVKDWPQLSLPDAMKGLDPGVYEVTLPVAGSFRDCAASVGFYGMSAPILSCGGERKAVATRAEMTPKRIPVPQAFMDLGDAHYEMTVQTSKGSRTAIGNLRNHTLALTGWK